LLELEHAMCHKISLLMGFDSDLHRKKMNMSSGHLILQLVIDF